MKKLMSSLYLVIFIAMTCGGEAQDYSAFHAVRSIDPEDTEYADLHFLKEMIGDSRIVLLGEQSHGEGAVFNAKTRLIKFLHAEMGFDVLAFESGIFDCAILWDSLQSFSGEADPLLTAQKAIFGIWTRSQELRNVFQYLIEQAATKNPLILSGFDDQFSGEFSEKHLLSELHRVQTEYGFHYSDSVKGLAFERILQRITEDVDYRPMVSRRTLFFEELDHLLKFTGSIHAADDRRARIIHQTLRSARELALRQFLDSSFLLRDKQMARNLEFLCDLYPQKKVIVWAASSHIMTDNTSIDDPDYHKFIPMGTYFKSLNDIATTTVGFTSYGGETYDHNEDKAVALEAPPANSIEQLGHDYGHPYSIIDFTKWQNRDVPRLSRPFGNVTRSGYWWRCFDLMFFIDQSTAKTYIYKRKPR